VRWFNGRLIWLSVLPLQVSVVRMSRCSHLYLTTVLLLHEGLVSTVGLKHLAYAIVSSTASSSLADVTVDSPTHVQHPCWFLPERPASSMKQLVVDWHVPLRDIKPLVEQWLQEESCEALYSKDYTWQGSCCCLSLELMKSNAAGGSAAAGKSFKIGCFLGSADTAHNEHELCKADFKMMLMKAGATQLGRAVYVCKLDDYIGAGTTWGSASFLFRGRASSWREVEQRLRAAEAVHADDCVHIKLVVKKLR
jgi:hypothetical protein